ncbi:MAG: pantoate--beta-alanine ligase [Acidobacteriia bacterium]|nr:pantoate--beta-alanine ligase [Terriglobia bacterium]
MQVSRTVAGWLARRLSLSPASIGFVPTMGALHCGHASLVKRSRAENELTVVSIFVNPAQFNDPTDLERYPRTVAQDLALLEELGVDEVLMPPAAEIYPFGRRFHIEEESLTQVMEGVSRPGFFQGVMTVVLKLLNLVRADRAYFGEKDYQQLEVIRDLAKEFFVPTEIVGCPTVRESSGLAASSRNLLLSPAGREKAAEIFRVLRTAADPLQAKTKLSEAGFTVDYVEEHFGRRFAAAHLEGIRLIDNVPLG